MSTCRSMLQKMIDVVPGDVVLTDPILPYMVKPVKMQLILDKDGSLDLTGFIRVKTTEMFSDSISGVTLTYKDRHGGSSCASCSTTSTVQGQCSGFDDSFVVRKAGELSKEIASPADSSQRFPISTKVDSATGISSFTVSVNLKNGTTQEYDNNGNSYPMSDAILLQKPQSCLLQGSGALNVSALVGLAGNVNCR